MTADLNYKRYGCLSLNCDNKHASRGLCVKHYLAHRKLGLVALDDTTCQHCNIIFSPRQFGALFCTPVCKVASWRKAHQEFVKAYRPPKVCKYFADFCIDCKCSVGGERKVKRCIACKRTFDMRVNADRSVLYANKMHRDAGLIVSCVECSIQFCLLYGAKRMSACPCCLLVRQRRLRAPFRLARAMRIKCKTVETVKPYVVFDRDKWTCQLCKRKTPRLLRGTIDLRAPELDHIIPVSRGGDHSYLNTQCACRGCNIAKGNKPMGQLLLIG